MYTDASLDRMSGPTNWEVPNAPQPERFTPHDASYLGAARARIETPATLSARAAADFIKVRHSPPINFFHVPLRNFHLSIVCRLV